jgi:hypothetical protein
MSRSFRYDYFKASELSQEERKRLRVMVRTQLQLKDSGNGASAAVDSRIVGELLNFIRSPVKNYSKEVCYWLLSYGSPKLLSEVIGRSRDLRAGNNRILHLIRKAGTDKLLPRDYIAPDIQRWQSCDNPRKALICFTGNAQRLNMPVQLFHCLVADEFDLILYLRDPAKRQFTHGVPGIADDIRSLSRYLRNRIPGDCKISVIGTSGGGYAAAEFSRWVKVDRMALFSPPPASKGVPVDIDPMVTPASRVRIYFACDHPKDRNWADSWSRTEYSGSLVWLKTDSHGTLGSIAWHGEFQNMLAWLSGNDKRGKLRSLLIKLFARQ